MKILLTLLLPVWLFAIPLSILIEHAKNNHTSLKSLEQRLSAIDNEYEISRNFQDPMVSLTVNDIQLDNITNRSIEPMQYTAINVSQKIPYFGKRDAFGNKILAKKEKVRLTIDAMKVNLTQKIKIAAYSIWEREEELKVTNQYISLTQQNIELYSAFSSSDTKSHMSIMSAEMSLSELKIKKSRLQSSLKGLYKRISYLCAMEVTSVAINMQISKPHPLKVYKENITNNISYKIKEASFHLATADTKVKELDTYIDPIIKVGYFQRDAYKDYINLGVSFKIPLYGTQDSHTQKSRKLALASENEKIDFNNLLLAKIVKVHAQLEDSYAVHKIIMHESMPQIEHMFELSSSSIKNGEELFLYIDLLQKKLSLDEKNITVIAMYHKKQAILDSLIGAMQ